MPSLRLPLPGLHCPNNLLKLPERHLSLPVTMSITVPSWDGRRQWQLMSGLSPHLPDLLIDLLLRDLLPGYLSL